MSQTMDNKELQQKWPELTEKLLAEHPQLTREELILEIGKEGETLGRITKKLGKTDKQIHDWLSLLG
jgi:hypothetical protein